MIEKNNIEYLINLHDEQSKESNRLLNQILRSDPDMRQQFAAYLADEELLIGELVSEQLEKVSQHDSLIHFTHTELAESQPKKSSLWSASLGLAAGIILTLGAYTVFQWSQSESAVTGSSTMASDSPQHEQWIAKIQTTSPTARWGDHVSGDLDAGHYELTSGEVSILFSNEVQLFVKAPAKFEIKSSMEVLLHRGAVRAHVTEAGHGFVIDTPQTKVRDLGTEFAVSVSEDKQTEVHVFNGEVELYKKSGGDPEVVRDGFAARWKTNTRQQIPIANDDAFPTHRYILWQNWLASQKKMKANHRLVANFSFQQSEQPRVLTNGVDGSDVANGTIHSPIWVRGRWPETQALLFDSSKQSVELSLPKKVTESFTLITWIKPDRFDFPLQAVLNSNQWRNNQHHWQISNTGALRVGVAGQQGFGITSKSKVVKIGKWSQLAVTYDSSTRKISYFVNDQKVISYTLKARFINFGKSHLGLWKSKSESKRPFRGKIDSLMMFNGCQSTQQISELYRVGVSE